MLLMTKSDIAQNFEYWKSKRQVSFHNMHFSFLLKVMKNYILCIFLHLNVTQIDVHLFM